MLPLLFACTDPPASDPPVETEGTLSLLTYNVQGLPDALTDSDRPNTERMSTIAPLLEDYDIIGLQEDFDPDNHALLTDTSHSTNEWLCGRVSFFVFG